MSRESESEQTQRTVAELLAQYGGGSGEVTPRRRRRRAEENTETGPQAIIDRVNSDSGRLRAIRDEPEPPPAAPPPAAPPPAAPPPPAPLPQRQRQRAVEAERTAYQPPPPLTRPEPPAARPEPPLSRLEPPASRLEPPSSRLEPPKKAESGRRRAPEVDPAEETRVVPPIVADYQGEPSRPTLPKPPVAPEPPRTNLVRPVPPGAVKPPVREPVTEVMPRITDKLTPNVPLESLPTESVLIVPPAPPRLPDPLPDQSPEDWFGDDDEPEEVVEQESTAFHPYVDLDEEDDDDYPRRDFQRRDLDDDEPAGLADLDDEDDERPVARSAGKEWLLMIGQLAAGVVGGAALWLGFNFLWRTAAPAALVVALAVTVGLVMMVRKIRRADDLQTTVLAVLVGLIVTVSPAAMLLVNN
ncbi:hypothetical protein FHX81_4739 [Saccharothrix saharensis]|uniref:Uncharacterized protein n=1 Tax=Saccharothrix saharensis TaxID=571190 RepID=A0A543JHR0_9PSEU|nr:hypothetical protein [Saccharothrix saharensis]TQM82335.1 hypothetical protein FHX81_4739 [Saccharothrix saharensis]